MKSIYTLAFALLLSVFGTAQADTPSIAECHHDTAQVDPGLYASDMLADNVVGQPFSVSKGTLVTMTYKVKDKIKQIKCLTAEPRVAYKNKNSDIIDARCGNKYLSGVSVPIIVMAKPPAVAASATCTKDDCDNLTVVKTVTHVTRRVELQTCHGSNEQISVDQKCPDIILSPVMVIVPPAQINCQACQRPPVVSAPQTKRTALCEARFSGEVVTERVIVPEGQTAVAVCQVWDRHQMALHKAGPPKATYYNNQGVRRWPN